MSPTKRQFFTTGFLLRGNAYRNRWIAFPLIFLVIMFADTSLSMEFSLTFTETPPQSVIEVDSIPGYGIALFANTVSYPDTLLDSHLIHIMAPGETSYTAPHGAGGTSIYPGIFYHAQELDAGGNRFGPLYHIGGLIKEDCQWENPQSPANQYAPEIAGLPPAISISRNDGTRLMASQYAFDRDNLHAVEGPANLSLSLTTDSAISVDEEMPGVFNLNAADAGVYEGTLLADDGEFQVEAPLVFTVGDYRISGQICLIDPYDSLLVVSGLVQVLHGAEYGDTMQVETDEQGNYELMAPSGNIRLRAYNPDSTDVFSQDYDLQGNLVRAIPLMPQGIDQEVLHSITRFDHWIEYPVHNYFGDDPSKHDDIAAIWEDLIGPHWQNVVKQVGTQLPIPSPPFDDDPQIGINTSYGSSFGHAIYSNTQFQIIYGFFSFPSGADIGNPGIQQNAAAEEIMSVLGFKDTNLPGLLMTEGSGFYITQIETDIVNQKYQWIINDCSMENICDFFRHSDY